MLLILPLSIFGQEKLSKKELWQSQKEAERLEKELSFMNKTPGSHFISASKNLKLGIGITTGGAVATTALILIGQGNNVSHETQSTLNTTAYIIGGASLIAGLVFTIKGYADIGKAGQKLNYELSGTSASLSFNF